MENQKKTYIAIDLKSFYASVECIERGLNPLTTNLVVADASRTEKTICLAVSPSLKKMGIPSRPRLFEVNQKIREINRKRQWDAPGKKLLKESNQMDDLKKNPSLAVGYIAAPPRMAYYIEYSAMIYRVYLKYIAPEDIHVYSIDEVFMDVTGYLKTYQCTAKELASRMIKDVLVATGITATAGIGTNLYLCKVAMDIMAKRIPADQDGVRIAELDEQTYREHLWHHRPLTDFWRIGAGISKKLESNGLYTMGDIARCSLGKHYEYHNEELLYKLFGINAELLIDHAWGVEPCTMQDIKVYRPAATSVGAGQVLHCPYTHSMAKIIVQEMADQLALDLVQKGLVSSQLVLTVGYDIENLTDAGIQYQGEVKVDHYGRRIPKHAHGTINLKKKTSSSRLMIEAATELYERIANPALKVRRISITACNVVDEKTVKDDSVFNQLDLFTDVDALMKKEEEEKHLLKHEKELQHAILRIKKLYGKNAILKGLNFEEGATAIDRNGQIGGHKA